MNKILITNINRKDSEEAIRIQKMRLLKKILEKILINNYLLHKSKKIMMFNIQKIHLDNQTVEIKQIMNHQKI